MQTILALDIGTTGTKAALMDRSGRLLATGYADYPTYTAAGNVVEQDPIDWWLATITALQQLSQRLAQNQSRDNSLPSWRRAGEGSGVGCIILSGQMQDCILLGCDDALGRAILYSDSRAREEAIQLTAVIGYDELAQLTGNEQGASSLLAKWLWLQKHDAERLAKTNAILIGAHDYVAWKLGAFPGADFTTASTTGLLDLAKREWAIPLLQQLGLDHFLLPTLQNAGTLAGYVGEDAAAATGLPAGTPILRGCGDLGATTLGVGAGEPGRLYAYLGTSGWVAGSLDVVTPNPKGGIFTLCHPDPRRFIQVAPMLTAGGNLEWLRSAWCVVRSEDAQSLNLPISQSPISQSPVSSLQSLSYDQLNTLAASSPPGSHGLIYLPYLSGERSPFSDVDVRACFIGISQQTTQAEMARAVMEGVAFAYRSLQEALQPLPSPPLKMEGAATGQAETKGLYLVGGGAKSSVWPQIIADVLNCTVSVVADPGDAGARGAALIAGKALGWYESYSPTPEFFPVSQQFIPNPENREVYDALYGVFRELYPQLKSSFARVAHATHSR